MALPIFPGSHPPSIVGVHELNFCVRDGNRWTLVPISTNYKGYTLKTEHQSNFAIMEALQLEPAYENCRSSPRLISIGQLHASRRFHLRPINDIVYVEPQWRSYLRGSFTLRCLQRLSRPHVATQPCPWQNNWYTRGASIPVLSY